jgi:hypothetical protein
MTRTQEASNRQLWEPISTLCITRPTWVKQPEKETSHIIKSRIHRQVIIRWIKAHLMLRKSPSLSNSSVQLLKGLLSRKLTQTKSQNPRLFIIFLRTWQRIKHSIKENMASTHRPAERPNFWWSIKRTISPALDITRRKQSSKKNLEGSMYKDSDRPALDLFIRRRKRTILVQACILMRLTSRISWLRTNLASLKIIQATSGRPQEETALDKFPQVIYFLF